MTIDPDFVRRRPCLMLGPPFHSGSNALPQRFDAAPKAAAVIICLYLFHRRLHRQDDFLNMGIPYPQPIGYRSFYIS